MQNNQNLEEKIKLIENLTYLDNKIKSYNEYITNKKNQSKIYQFYNIIIQQLIIEKYNSQNSKSIFYLFEIKDFNKNLTWLKY